MAITCLLLLAKLTAVARAIAGYAPGSDDGAVVSSRQKGGGGQQATEAALSCHAECPALGETVLLDDNRHMSNSNTACNCDYFGCSPIERAPDLDSAGWYRFGGDDGATQMATCFVQGGSTGGASCGTTGCTGFLATPHPAAGDAPAAAQVCFNCGDSSGCDFFVDANVCACDYGNGGGTTYTYQLTKPAGGSGKRRYCGSGGEISAEPTKICAELEEFGCDCFGCTLCGGGGVDAPPPSIPSPSLPTTGITYPPPPPTTGVLPKILCLHGGGGDGADFAGEITAMRNTLSNEFEFVFPTAPDPPGEGGLWMMDPPGKDNPTTDPDWAQAAVAHLNQIVTTQGPFHGIMGYSQGAAFLPVYLALTPVNTFQFAAMFCGYLPETHLGLIGRIDAQSPFGGIPSLHFIGLQDGIIGDTMSRTVSELKAAYSSDALPLLLQLASGEHAAHAPDGAGEGGRSLDLATSAAAASAGGGGAASASQRVALAAPHPADGEGSPVRHSGAHGGPAAATGPAEGALLAALHKYYLQARMLVGAWLRAAARRGRARARVSLLSLHTSASTSARSCSRSCRRQWRRGARWPQAATWPRAAALARVWMLPLLALLAGCCSSHLVGMLALLLDGTVRGPPPDGSHPFSPGPPPACRSYPPAAGRTPLPLGIPSTLTELE
ncbi:hypothetical protein EMIHUDRAFT_468183 [Emiliania huxleyi CCMP1516]|uniref:Serine hydrolase domain-containing protein n=2 Tax=Emiliania huxleyi TaxID=2903 RepID=A0A0D3K6S9_EMIH1|nr:hypothetical protein EMIHUDRAFT_468183 [Emiliania huxleyi CCMP1516]EOD31464.1 hypothetical protein EMIHUDRAFT_468183 [Emiliania huxleyi CCMP1516]|eukprot:XP_005783893.1 hypothetical protein EMIHUDRAFT_468183 [Emiliania huxleyi CCMP1516]